MLQFFEYVYLDSGIHRFRWLSRSSDSTSEYFDFIVQLYDNLPDDTKVVRMLHDYQHLQFIPLVNVFPQLKALQSMYPHINRKIAYLSDADRIEALMESLVNATQRSGDRKFFKTDEEELAIEWLLTDDGF